MFHTLIASGPQPTPGMPRVLASTTLHGLVVAAAVIATRPSAPTAREAARESVLVFTVPLPPPRTPPTMTDLHPGVPAPRPSWPTALEVPKVSVDQIMSSLPTVSDVLSRVASPSGVPVSSVPDSPGAGPWAADAVDEPIEVLEQAPLRYPPALAQAAIPGMVELEFVVDTSGWAERESIRALASTRPEFEAAARAAILHTRYRPARARGRVVRQLVRQTLSFRAVAGIMPPASRRASAASAR